MSANYGGRLGAVLKVYPRVYCPVCQTPQVQIINYLKGDPQWKCRKCKQKFTLPFNDAEYYPESFIDLDSIIFTGHY